jgi:type I restriction enzyme R subunit
MKYDMIAEGGQSTVVAEYTPSERKATEYQSEAELEKAFIAQLESQAYERINITSEQDLIVNLRTRIGILNDHYFTDSEWNRFFTDFIASPNAIKH